MKKIFYVMVVALLCCNSMVKAAPGDTTWVQANLAQLQGYGSYDSVVAFPNNGKTYRTILMIFTLGKYVCPGSPTYCGDWDYTVQNYLTTRRGQRFELGRLITPYANAGAPRTPNTWKQHYVFDVTDYAPVLRDSATMSIFYSGYSGGFTANIRFAFIEGAPDREVVGIKRLWNGSYSYGDTSRGGIRDINTHFPTIRDTAPANARAAELKFTVTGHGSDPNYCNEFCSHSYFVFQNRELVDSYRIWRSDCGKNELYPQSGTWIYERANWCPGAMVYSEHHPLSNIYAGQANNIGLQFEYYAGNGGASYTTEATLFYYGGLKKFVDASIDQIIAPTLDENHFRENPICGSPMIHIKNRGAATIDSIVFQYGIKGSAMQTSVWKGSLATFAEADVTLPALGNLNSVSGDTAKYTFVARILTVNGGADVDSTNDMMATQFVPAPLWPSSFKLLMRTNNAKVNTTSNVSETSWRIYDMDNNIVAKRVNANITTLYTDTVDLPTGCYRLEIADSGCDGLQWWANASAGAGSFLIKKLSGVNIQMNGYNPSGQYNNDFGCGFSQYFYTVNPLRVTNIAEGTLAMEAYPNPAQNLVSIDITGTQLVTGTIQVIDAVGRVVVTVPCNNSHEQINVSNLSNGAYTILFVNTVGNRLQTRLLINK